MTTLSLGVRAVQLSDLSSCPQTCVANMLNQATALGCTSASDTTCLCSSTSFTAGATDCTSKSCTADQVTELNTYLTNMCGAAWSASSSATTAAATTAVAGAATTSVAATTTDAVAGAVTTSLTSTTAPAGVTTSSAAAATTAIAGVGANSTLATTARTSSTHTPTTLVSSATATSTSEATAAAAASSSSTGLSKAAKVGIGMGVGATAVAFLVIAAVYMFKKNKGASEYNGDKVHGGPMASAGSQFGYSSTHQRLSDSAGGELKGTRYEDMVPRAAPKNMV